jgi:hypothetical protein
MADSSKAVVPAEDQREEREAARYAELLARAKTPDERAFAYRSIDKHRAMKLVQKAAELVAGTSWGKNMSERSRAVYAAYCFETGTDPLRHWYILGDRMYDNAELWMDLAAAHEDFAGADEPRFIHADARCSAEEATLRQQLRVQHGVPEDTPGAAIVTIHTKSRGDFIGCNWVKMHKTSEGKWRDSIGHQEPTLSAVTRAWRKAAKRAFPLWFLKHPLAQRLTAQLEEERGMALVGYGEQRKVGIPSDDVQLAPTPAPEEGK